MTATTHAIIGNDDFDDPVTDYLLPVYPDPEFQRKSFNTFSRNFSKKNEEIKGRNDQHLQKLRTR